MVSLLFSTADCKRLYFLWFLQSLIMCLFVQDVHGLHKKALDAGLCAFIVHYNWFICPVFSLCAGFQAGPVSVELSVLRSLCGRCG